MILKVQFCLIFNSITQLNELIKKSVDDRQNLLDKIKKIETEMKSLSQDMENINKYREIYKYHKKNPNDKQFAEEYYSELSVYKIVVKEILENYKN